MPPGRPCDAYGPPYNTTSPPQRWHTGRSPRWQGAAETHYMFTKNDNEIRDIYLWHIGETLYWPRAEKINNNNNYISQYHNNISQYI